MEVTSFFHILSLDISHSSAQFEFDRGLVFPCSILPRESQMRSEPFALDVVQSHVRKLVCIKVRPGGGFYYLKML